MRTALIFPPQWDPRQPPLAPALLASIIKSPTSKIKIYDLNLALYKHLLQSKIPGGIEDFLVERLLNPISLRDAKSFIKTSQSIQRIFDERFDEQGLGRLFWDGSQISSSENTSTDWRNTIAKPNSIPFYEHLKTDIANILEWKPDIIGISAISDTQLHAALSLATYYRHALPNSKIILGGNAITYRRSLLLDKSWLGSIFDAVCIGDGEPFMKMLNNQYNLATMPNLLSWNKIGQSFTTKAKLHDLSYSYFPDFESLPLKDYLTPHLVIPIETARGCPWGRCSYCIHPVKTAKGISIYRPKTITLVKKEIEHLFSCGHRRFFIIDEAIPPARMRELTTIFKSLPEPISWIGYSRLDNKYSRNDFMAARSSGCLKLFIGVETGSDNLLQSFNKGVTSSQARRVLLDIASADIAVHFFLMTGFPKEEEKDREATLDLLSDVLPAFDPFGFSFDLFALSGELETDLMNKPQSYGWTAPAVNSSNDLAWQFPILSGHKATENFVSFKNQIHNLSDSILGTSFGLRHASIGQDSLHLLLIEAQNDI